MKRGVPEVEGQRHDDRCCPKCRKYRAMTNPHPHDGSKPFLCMECGQQFDAPQDTE